MITPSAVNPQHITAITCPHFWRCHDMSPPEEKQKTTLKRFAINPDPSQPTLSQFKPTLNQPGATPALEPSRMMKKFFRWVDIERVHGWNMHQWFPNLFNSFFGGAIRALVAVGIVFERRGATVRYFTGQTLRTLRDVSTFLVAATTPLTGTTHVSIV